MLVRALYGLKSAGSSWRASLAKVLEDLEWKSTKADPDVWIRPAVRPDGYEYYKMLLVYVDDILAISHKAKEVLQQIAKFYKIKDGSLKEPDLYLGANVSKFQKPDGTEAWSTSPQQYIKSAVENVERILVEDGEGYGLKNNVRNPFPTGYRPELDVTDELSGNLCSRYWQLIGVGRWAVELGQIDIFHELSLLSQYQASPCVGHL